MSREKQTLSPASKYHGGYTLICAENKKNKTRTFHLWQKLARSAEFDLCSKNCEPSRKYHEICRDDRLPQLSGLWWSREPKNLWTSCCHDGTALIFRRCKFSTNMTQSIAEYAAGMNICVNKISRSQVGALLEMIWVASVRHSIGNGSHFSARTCSYRFSICSCTVFAFKRFHHRSNPVLFGIGHCLSKQWQVAGCRCCSTANNLVLRASCWFSSLDP